MFDKKRSHHDSSSFYNISDSVSKGPYDSLDEIIGYVDKYPNDSRGKTLLALNLLKIGKFDEAWNVLDETEKEIENSQYYAKNIKEKEAIEYLILITRLKLLSYSDKYEEFLDYWFAYSDMIYKNRKIDLINAHYYIKKQLGKLYFIRNSYTSNQILSYDYDMFLKHLKNHMCESETSDKISVFYLDFPMEKVLEEVKKYLMAEGVEKIYSGYFEDLYVFKYDNCGKDNKNKKTDYFSITTFHNTEAILNMNPYPYKPIKHDISIDLNYLKEEEFSKVKRKSAIDKFNEKYKKY